MVKVKINGKEIEAKEGSYILEVAREHGIDIPTLCYDKTLSKFGGCRLCLVEIEGYNKLETSCSTLVKEGMDIQTESPKVVKMRKEILDLLYSNHPEEILFHQLFQ